MAESLVSAKSFSFAVRIIQLCRHLRQQNVERELLSQLIRSGTSIAANLSEAVYGSSRKDFFSKARIALKECSETHTWLKLLHATGSLTEPEYDSINGDCTEILKCLSPSIKPLSSPLLTNY